MQEAIEGEDSGLLSLGIHEYTYFDLVVVFWYS